MSSDREVKKASPKSSSADSSKPASKQQTGERDVWVGFDLGGTKMLAVVFDSKMKPLGRERKKTKGFEGAEAGLKRIKSVIESALEEAEVDVSRVAGIGIGCPGPLDLKKGVVREAPNLGWKDVPVKKFLESEFGCPAVIMNDVDAGVFGEWSHGAGKDARCLVGIFPGTGIGGGCVYKGEIFQGANHSCMEIGHIPIVSDSLPDGCGNVGTLEAVGSRLSIAAGAAQAAYRGQAPWLQKKAGADIADIRSGVLADSVKNGDKAVEVLVDRAAQYLSLGIVTMVHLLSPETIVIGGGLAEAFPDLLVKNAEKKARARVMPAYADSFDVVLAKLGDDSGVVGAASWAKKVITEAT